MRAATIASSFVATHLSFAVIVTICSFGFGTPVSGQAPITFAAPSCHSVGTDPTTIHAVDIDSDGDQDLLAVLTGTSRISISLNDGSGTFSFATTVDVGLHPTHLTSGDFDLDGDLDLATSNDQGHSISLLMADGTPFTRIDLAVPNGKPGIIAADIDGDLDLDIVVGGGFVIRNAGVGFVPAQSLFIGAVDRLWAADVDGDGDVDLVSTKLQSPSGALPPFSLLSVFVNDGTGFFVPLAPVTYYGNGTDIASSDIDLDGDEDFAIVCDAQTSNVSIITNGGGSTFTPTAALPLSFFPTGGFLGTNGIIDADLDNDGDRDLCVGYIDLISSSSGCAIFRNAGNGTFVPGPFGAGATTTLSLSSDPGFSFTVGFLSGDGIADLAWVSSTPSANDACVAFNTTLAMIPPPPVTLSIVQGGQQAGHVDRDYPIPVIVRATTQGNVPVAGHALTFSPGQGDLVTSGSTTVITDLFGRAAVTLRASSISGPRMMTVSALAAPSLSIDFFAREHVIQWSNATGHFVIDFINDKSGVPLFVVFDLAPIPPAPIPTAFGPIHVGIFSGSPALVMLDGLGLIGPPDANLVTSPNFTRTYVVTPAAVAGVHVTSQVFGIDYSETYPANVIASNPVFLVL